MRDLVNIVKIGGNIIDDEQKLAPFLKNFGAISGKKLLVHGGGKLATKLAERLGVQQQMMLLVYAVPMLTWYLLPKEIIQR